MSEEFKEKFLFVFDSALFLTLLLTTAWEKESGNL